MRPGMLAVVLMLAVVPIGAQSPPQWKLVEEWRVGGEATGPLSFDDIGGYGLLPKGGIVHYNQKDHQLHFLDARGKVIRSVGRQGSGPGEFGRVAGMTVAADGRVIVNDYSNGFVIYSADGKFLKAARPTIPFMASTGGWRVTPQSDGRLLEVVPTSPAQNRGRTEGRVLWAGDFSRFDTLPATACGLMGGRPRTTVPLKGPPASPPYNMPVPYIEPNMDATFTGNGWVWEAVPRNSSTIIRHRLTDCTAAAKATLDGQQVPLMPWQREAIRSQVAAEAKRWQATMPELGSLPSVNAWFENLFTDPVGNLWVERLIDEKGSRATEIFSPAGKLIGVVQDRLPAFPVVGGDHLYAIAADKDGVRYLVSYRIQR